MNFSYDFAVSYAGEDESVAIKSIKILKEFGYSVFFAPFEKYKLVGADGEQTFTEVFTKSKQVLVYISKHYRDKNWPRFEWDIILKRDPENRYIPIKLDDTDIIGLPGNIILIDYSKTTDQEIADIAIKKLLEFEKNQGIKRKTEFEETYDKITNESKGSLDKAYQLVIQKKERKPLEKFVLTESPFNPSYKIVHQESINFSVVRRELLRIILPDGLSREEVVYNLKHCCVELFNTGKYDAVGVFAYKEGDNPFDIFTIGRADFAPFGDWGQSIEGVAYDLPTKIYDFNIKLNNNYFKN